MRSSVLMAIVLFTGAAVAQTATRPARAPGGPSEFQAAMNEGHRLMVARDFDAAANAYRRAAALQADSAEPHLFVGFALRARGQAAAGLESFRVAARMARASGDPLSEGKALFNVASTLEAAGDLDGARTAWQAYVTFADSNATVTSYPGSGRARVQAIDRVSELARAYQDVRRRIAERERENASSR